MKNERKTLRNDSNQRGREVWKAVDRAASRAPEWIRKRVEAAPLSDEGTRASKVSEPPKSSS